jgi:SsrA-binding protein
MIKKIIVNNKKASFEYFIDYKLEAGIALRGSEVKALRQGKANLEDSYVIDINKELFLVNMHIGHYDKANRTNHEYKRQRKLLLHQNEIDKMIGRVKVKGYSIVPTMVYFNDKSRVKIEIALAKGKQLHDKRETLKNKEWEREKQRITKTGRLD